MVPDHWKKTPKGCLAGARWGGPVIFEKLPAFVEPKIGPAGVPRARPKKHRSSSIHHAPPSRPTGFWPGKKVTIVGGPPTVTGGSARARVEDSVSAKSKHPPDGPPCGVKIAFSGFWSKPASIPPAFEPGDPAKKHLFPAPTDFHPPSSHRGGWFPSRCCPAVPRDHR